MEYRRGFTKTRNDRYEIVDTDTVYQIVDTETYMIMDTHTGEYQRFGKHKSATSSNLDEALDYLAEGGREIIIKVSSMTRFIIEKVDKNV